MFRKSSPEASKPLTPRRAPPGPRLPDHQDHGAPRESRGQAERPLPRDGDGNVTHQSPAKRGLRIVRLNEATRIGCRRHPDAAKRSNVAAAAPFFLCPSSFFLCCCSPPPSLEVESSGAVARGPSRSPPPHLAPPPQTPEAVHCGGGPLPAPS